MSTLAEADPQTLRAVLRERIDRCTSEELDAVRKALLVFEARRTFDEIGREMDEDWSTGKVTDDTVASAIREHRGHQPYQ